MVHLQRGCHFCYISTLEESSFLETTKFQNEGFDYILCEHTEHWIQGWYALVAYVESTQFLQAQASKREIVAFVSNNKGLHFGNKVSIWAISVESCSNPNMPSLSFIKCNTCGKLQELESSTSHNSSIFLQLFVPLYRIQTFN